MTYAISNETSERIIARIRMGATMAVTLGGYRIRIPVGPHIKAETIEEALPGIETYLMDEEGLRPGARQVTATEVILHIGASLEKDNLLLFYEGRMSRIGPGRDGQMLALLDDTIVPIDYKSPHVMLARDGDRISLGYRRLHDGKVVVGGFNNHALPPAWRDS